MKLEAALFDLDGTLLDTLRDIAEAMNSALARLGHPAHPLDSYRYFVGSGMRLLAERALPVGRKDPDTVERAVELMRAEYDKSWDRTTKPFEGVETMLSALDALGVKTAVLSNKPDDFTKMCVARMLPGATFAAVVGAREGAPSKPAPDSALRIASGLGVEPARCAFVGDTPIDVETALRAGMLPVGVTWGFRPAGELTAAGAAMLVSSPAEIVDIFKKS